MFTNRPRPLCFLAFSLLWAPAVADSQPAVIDRIVAVVGKEPILLSDLNAQAEFYALNNHIDPNTPALKQQLLDAMVNEKLILAKALEDTTITVREDEVTSQLDALIAQRIQQVGSEKKLEELYGMPISRMKREVRDETRKQLLIQYLQEAKFGSIQPSRREVEEFYKTFKDSLPTLPEHAEVYHILKIPRASEAAKASVKEKAARILDSIKAGGDFADFARRYSEDPATASSGGDLGSWRRGQFVKDFEEAVFSLKEKQISDIVETSRGFHIIQLLERHGELAHARHILFKIGVDSSSAAAASGSISGYQILYLKRRVPEHTMNLKDDWKQVEQLAASYKRNFEYQKWLKQLRQEIYWEVRL